MRAVFALLCLSGMTLSGCMPSPTELEGPARVSFWRSHRDTPVMTHLVASPPATATVVLPQLANRASSNGPKSGVVTLLEVPRLSPDTRIDVKSLATLHAETAGHE